MTTRCGIVLHPTGHTLSPLLHTTAYASLGLDASYEVHDVLPSQLAARVAELRASGMKQLAVSLPHKHAALDLADKASEASRAIGAANTLTEVDGLILADNTDWIGVTRMLELLGSWKDKTALVIGAGGAARAVVYATRQLGMRVGVVNRTRARAERLASDLGAELGSLEAPYDLLVNATTVGMQPDIDATPVPAAMLRPEATICDAVYRPLETRLLREARARGCRIQDGLDWLVLQAVEQIRLWSGQSPDPAALRRAALAEVGG